GDVAEVAQKTVDQLVRPVRKELVTGARGPVSKRSALGLPFQQPTCVETLDEGEYRRIGDVTLLGDRFDELRNGCVSALPEDVHHLGLRLPELARDRISVATLQARPAVQCHPEECNRAQLRGSSQLLLICSM